MGCGILRAGIGRRLGWILGPRFFGPRFFGPRFFGPRFFRPGFFGRKWLIGFAHLGS